jgi:hypothetical protein
MEIRDAPVDKEHSYTDDGEEICCPICGTAWLQEEEGDVTFDNCEHLRFSLHSDCNDDFEIFDEWDSDSFLELVEKAREKDEEADILDILGKIHHRDVEKAMLYVCKMIRYLTHGCYGDINRIEVPGSCTIA